MQMFKQTDTLQFLNPFRAPEPLPTLNPSKFVPTLNPSKFVPKNGFPVVKGLTLSQRLIILGEAKVLSIPDEKHHGLRTYFAKMCRRTKITKILPRFGV